jgi:hypothetical protein
MQATREGLRINRIRQEEDQRVTLGSRVGKRLADTRRELLRPRRSSCARLDYTW